MEEAVDGVVGLHGTDATTVVLSAWARLADRACGPEAVERALYEERTLVRLLSMRRTIFVVGREVAPDVLAGSSLAVAARERRTLLKMVAAAGLGDGDPAAWVAEAEAAALRALHDFGEATAPEVAATDDRLGAEVVVGSGNYTARQKVASRVLAVLSAEGRVLRARPKGGWTSTQFRWTAADQWLGAPLAEHDVVQARAALAGRWLAAFGPATAEDLAWWAGWSLRDTRAALAAGDPEEVVLEDGTPALVAAGDAGPVEPPAPWVALLPALDPTTMGWKARGFYLGAHGPRLFDANGNAGPTAWVDGRVVGGWAQHDDGEVAIALLEDVGAEATAALEAEAAALTARLAGVKVVAARARALSPVERELRG